MKLSVIFKTSMVFRHMNAKIINVFMLQYIIGQGKRNCVTCMIIIMILFAVGHKPHVGLDTVCEAGDRFGPNVGTE